MAQWVLRTVGVLLMLTALGLALSRAPDRPVETLVGRWAPPPSDFVEVKGQVVHIRDEGPRHDGVDSPLPIVLIHGTSASLHTWEGWVKALKGRRRVITFDLPGFGLTGPFGGQYTPDDYRGDTLARFTIDLLDQLKLPRVVIGGNSLGGEVAWRVATLAPARVGGLILVDAAGPPFKRDLVPLGWVMAYVPVLNRLSEYALPRSLVVQGLASAYAQPARLTETVVDRYFELMLRSGNRRALSLRLQQWTPGEDAERIATIKTPTLILWGARDRLIPPATAGVFQRDIAGSQLVLLDGLGHVPQEEDPARSVLPVQAFLGLK